MRRSPSSESANRSWRVRSFLEASELNLQLEEIQRASVQAKGVTDQLLTFSRTAPAKAGVVDVNEMVEASGDMLDRLVRDDVRVQRDLGSGLPPVWINRTQLEQVIVNLMVNAQDAISGPGEINLRTGLVDLDEEYSERHLQTESGPRVVLTVSDNGRGMDEKTRAKIFDPFFTTKDSGDGTGLGLSTVYGIIEEAGGHIGVYSEPGQGTTFKIYLPPAEGEVSAEPDTEVRSEEELHGSETILLVDDEEGVRSTGVRILRRYGYRALEAADPEEARRIFAQEEGAIDLVVTDVVLPRTRGPELAAKLREEAPELPVVYMSGFSEENAAEDHELGPSPILIEKPFEVRAFVAVIRETLDAL